MTDHLHALAMRTKAAALRDDMADLIGAKPMSSIHSSLCEYANAILALPLEADHAALLAEAVELPEIAALVEAVSALGLRKLVAGWNGEDRENPYPPHPPRLGVTLKTNAGAVYAIDAALAALETP